jgi:hypothetical protein
MIQKEEISLSNPDPSTHTIPTTTASERKGKGLLPTTIAGIYVFGSGIPVSLSINFHKGSSPTHTRRPAGSGVGGRFNLHNSSLFTLYMKLPSLYPAERLGGLTSLRNRGFSGNL